MAGNVYNSNGWDLIAAASQEGLNAQLAKIPLIPIKKEVKIKFLGVDVTTDLDIKLGPPQLAVKDGSGRQVDVQLPITGTITMNGEDIPIGQGQVVTVTTQLMQIEAELNPHPGDNLTTYDLVIDFESKDALVDMSIKIDAATFAALVSVLKQVIREDIGNGKQYKVASFTLSDAQAQEYKALIPYVADFSFVQDTENPGRSNLLVLMQTVTKTKGNIFFNNPILDANQDFMVLLSNELLLQYFVMPAMVDHIKKQAKKPSEVAGQISLHALPQPYLYEVKNNSNINLDKDHDPWISDLNAAVDTNQQALCFYLDAKADVTFLSIRVEAWDRSWQQFKVDEKDNITLVQIKEDKNSSTYMDWWKWLIAVLLGAIALIVTGIIYAITESNTPDLGGTFVDVGKNVVQWPNQKTVILKKMSTPNHVIMDLEVHFLD